MTQWIDFKLLKQQLSFEAVLDHYGIKTIKDGEQHVKTCCPFHDDKRPSLGVDLKRKIWQCFACKTSGNVLDFITRMEGYDPSDPGAIRKGAEAATEIMSLDLDAHVAIKSIGAERVEPRKAASQPVPKQVEPPEDVPSDAGPDNAPLSFELKLERSHKFLKAKGFKKSTYATFGIGYCKRGMMKGRICFPLYNVESELIGYAGYLVSDEETDDVPRWLYPPRFDPSRFLFNWHRFTDDPPEHVVLTGSYWDVLACYEDGIVAVCTPAFEMQTTQLKMLRMAGVNRLSIIQSAETVKLNLKSSLEIIAQHMFVRIGSLIG